MSLSFDYQGHLLAQTELAALTAAYEESFPTLRERSFLVEIQECTADEIAELNQRFRQKPEPTDVLSFPLFHTLQEASSHPGDEVALGSIAIAPSVASNLGSSPLELVHHGLLHLLGYDHETDLTTWRQVERGIIQETRNRHLSLTELP